MRNIERARSAFVALLGVLTCLTPVAAQENPPSAISTCLAVNERVYQPGADGVKPPQPQPSAMDKTAPNIRGPFSIELLVNSEGRVCRGRVLNAKDQFAAEKAAKYILEHWTFKPAMKQGNAVAVKFTTIFGPR